MNLLILYVANLILDYPLQGTFLAEYKAKNNYILFVHCAILAGGKGEYIPTCSGKMIDDFRKYMKGE